MPERPRLINILRNDSWAATTLAAAFFLGIITTIAQIANWVTGMELSDIGNYLRITGAALAFAAVFVPLRVRHVLGIFENGVETKAQVVSIKVHRTNMKFTLNYKFNGSDRQSTLDQVITGHTRRFLKAKEVVLIVDRVNPSRILLRDAYF